MKKCLPALALLLFTINLDAQYKVQFVFRKLPAYHKKTDTVFLAGSFNRWNPRNTKFSCANCGEKSGITIDLQKGMFEYKFTHGSWDAVETGAEGFPTENRMVTVERDTTIYVDIDHWADHFPRKAKETTASKNVQILDTAFYIPQLNRHRRVWIYLPESYSTTKKKYPVLYMHDGQNLFDNATAGFGEWGVDEALDTLGKMHGEGIVVAVDHGSEKRINEYSPFDMEQYGKGEGDAYVDFLVQTLMPYINNHYRTKKSARYTAVAGSSMGGLISFYAMMKYPDKFGAAGVFSPAFWVVQNQLRAYAAKRAPKLKGRLYFYAGQQESETMVPDMLSIFETVNGRSKAKLKTHIRAEGKHSEETWRAEFPLFYEWLMKEKDDE
ncbi:MAG TPA: alpha/beta hydrolase-fold protein [Flavisolibacter sp.]|nr:alpha/beta hydrolase-fold protein [Flavisolibacter sp.]